MATPIDYLGENPQDTDSDKEDGQINSSIQANPGMGQNNQALQNP